MRLAKRKYCETKVDLYDPASPSRQWNSGYGAYVTGGRWNSPSHYMLYTSDSAALSVLELVVNIEDELPTDPYAIMEIEIPESRGFIFACDWRPADDTAAQRLGDEWLASNSDPVLKVASVIAPLSFNYLINPNHPQSSEVRLVKQHPFVFDPRIRGRAPAS